MKHRIKHIIYNNGSEAYFPQYKWLGLIWLTYTWSEADIPFSFKTREECVDFFKRDNVRSSVSTEVEDISI